MADAVKNDLSYESAMKIFDDIQGEIEKEKNAFANFSNPEEAKKISENIVRIKKDAAKAAARMKELNDRVKSNQAEVEKASNFISKWWFSELVKDNKDYLDKEIKIMSSKKELIQELQADLDELAGPEVKIAEETKNDEINAEAKKETDFHALYAPIDKESAKSMVDNLHKLGDGKTELPEGIEVIDHKNGWRDFISNGNMLSVYKKGEQRAMMSVDLKGKIAPNLDALKAEAMKDMGPGKIVIMDFDYTNNTLKHKFVIDTNAKTVHFEPSNLDQNEIQNKILSTLSSPTNQVARAFAAKAHGVSIDKVTLEMQKSWANDMMGESRSELIFGDTRDNTRERIKSKPTPNKDVKISDLLSKDESKRYNAVKNCVLNEENYEDYVKAARDAINLKYIAITSDKINNYRSKTKRNHEIVKAREEGRLF